MNYSFNLIDQPWIPIITSTGEFREVGLYDLLAHAHEIREICGETPVITAAILPLTLAVLHRVFDGPASMGAWKNLWNEGIFPVESLEAYFQQWYERFDLFHPERPFYQAKDERVKPKSMIHLIHSIGNTGTLFTHENDSTNPEIEPAQAARYLITAQMFRTAGLSGLPEKFTDSPLTRGVLFFASGDNLFEALMLNLIAYPSFITHITATPDDKPVWEQAEPFRKRLYPYGYLDYLTWPSNHILLIPETVEGRTIVNTMTVAPGLNMAVDVISPQKRYIARDDPKKGKLWSFMYFNPDKALWREYHSLLAFADAKPPAVVEWFSQLSGYILPDNTILQLSAMGMLADQAKPIFYRQEKMPLPLSLLQHTEHVIRVAQAIQHADEIADKLNHSLNALAEQVLMRGGDSKPDAGDRRNLVKQWGVLSIYWEQLETHFWDFVLALSQNSDGAIEHWHQALVKTALDALNKANSMCGTDAAALHGQVIAQRILKAGINKVFP